MIITRVVQVSSWDVSIVRWVQWVGVLAFTAILTIGLQWDSPLVMDVMVFTIQCFLRLNMVGDDVAVYLT